MPVEKKVVLVKADGTRQELRSAKKPDRKQMQAWVGGWIEPVHSRFEGKAAVMVVNEEGLLHNLPVNREASKIAGTEVVGDAFILVG